jgi:hypothetical protein
MRSVKFVNIKFCRKEITVLKASRLKKAVALALSTLLPPFAVQI